MKKIILTLGIFSSFGLIAQNNVGIGTLTPNSQAILEIKSDDKGILISRLTTLSRTTLGTSLTATEDGMLVYDKDMTTFFYWDGPNLQWVQVGSGTGDNWGTDVVNITGTNITGDGTPGAPITITEVDGDITNEIQDLSLNPATNILTITNNGTATNIDLTPYIDNTDAQDLSYNPNTNVLTLTNDGTTVDLSTIKDHDWYEVGGTNQADAITDDIFTQGNVGIGIISPTHKLHVLGGDVFVGMTSGLGYGSLGSGGLELYRDPTGTVPTVNGFIDFKDNGSDDSDFRIFYNNSIGTNGALVFSGSNTGSPNGAPQLLIRNQDGNVGINTATPASKLHVATPDVYAVRIQSTANAYTAPGLQSVLAFTDINDDVYAYLGDGSSADQLTIVSYFNYDINLSSFSSNTSASRTGTIFMEGTNGNVGINTKVPTEKLEEQGSIKIVDGSEGLGKVLVSDATGKGSWKSLKPAFTTLSASIPSGTMTTIPPATTTIISGNITVTDAGLYYISGNAPFSTNVAANSEIYISLYRNGIRTEILYNNSGGISTSNYIWHFTKYLTPGVYDVRVQNLSTNAIASVSGINFSFRDFIDID